jgi:hypothetical protein
MSNPFQGFTPLPWRRAPGLSRYPNEHCVFAANGRLVFSCWRDDEPTNKAHAEMIVRAVNSHEQLLYVAKWYARLETVCGRGIGGKGCGECLPCSARSAIAKAEGRAS